MKKLKVLSIVTIIVAIALIITGHSMLFINDYRVDAQETKSYASLIKNSYDSYRKELENISFDIKNTTIFNVKYYSQIKDNYADSTDQLNTIEEEIRSIEATSNNLLHECQVREYNDYDIENKCDMINYNYESIINAFVSISEKYNLKIEAYNDWIKTDNKLKRYEAKYYKEYVDMNSDNIY